MRVIGNFPHEEFMITLFSWNSKYLIKFEKGNLEQTYKVSEFDVTGQGEVEEMLQNEPFMQKIATRFEEMQEDLARAMSWE